MLYLVNSFIETDRSMFLPIFTLEIFTSYELSTVSVLGSMCRESVD